MPGAQSAIWPKVLDPSSRLRRMMGVQRWPRISAALAMGQYWPYVRMGRVSRLRAPGASPFFGLASPIPANAPFGSVKARVRWEKGMTTMVERATSDSQAGSARYRAAEQKLWARYGLEPKERWVELAEPRARLRILEVGTGSGRPVLFVPGTGGTGPYWAPLVAKLPGFRCLLLDRPGWGLSSPIDWTRDEFAATTRSVLTGVLDALGLQQVDLVGASIGNLWGLRLAEQQPERVGRLVLLGGFPAAGSHIPTFIKLLTSPLGALIVRVRQSAKMQRSQVAAVGHGASIAAGRMDSFLEWRLSFVRDTPSMRHERSMAQAVVRGGAYRPGVTFDDTSLSAILHPVRMVFGSADPTGSVDGWRDFVSHLPSGELQIMDGAGHVPWWDDPERVAEAVGSFLAAGAQGAKAGSSGTAPTR